MAYGAADWQTAVFRDFKIQPQSVSYNDFLLPLLSVIVYTNTRNKGVRREVA